MIRLLLTYFKPHRRIFAIDMACAFLVAGVDLAFPLISRYTMYGLLPEHRAKAFYLIMLMIALFYLVRSYCYYIMTYLGHTFGVRVEADIRADLFRHLQELDYEFYDRNRTGKLMSRLTADLFEITELAHHGPEDLVIAVLTIIGALSCMFYIRWELALVVAAIIPIFLIIVMFRRRNMAQASSNVKKKVANINSDIESCISGIKTSKAFANEDVERERFERSNDVYKETKKAFYKSMGTFMATQEFFICIMPVAVIAFGGMLIMDGKMNFIDLIVFTLFVSTFITPVRKMSNFAEVFTNGLAGLRRFKEIMSIKAEVEEKEDAVPLKLTEGAINIENVNFSYNDNTEVLNNVSLKINGGEVVAVVGHSGGGKTTLCQLIPRFYDVKRGRISVDGQDVRDLTKSSLRENIGIVQQDVFIFADTIFNNIKYGKPEATFEEVVEAAKKAEIYQDIMNMPDGFDTYVGERGTKLSGGQKQRVSIARIFLKNPGILILDEATSALDTITEQKIQRSFEELSKGRTTLVIAHRLATVKNADRIVVIEEGKIAEEGSHNELIKAEGMYAKLYNTQKLFEKEVLQ